MSNMVGGYEIGEASTPKKSSNQKSEVWEHFSKLRNVNGTDTKVKCKHCNTDLSYTMGTTSHLRRHLASCSEAPEQVRTQFSKKPKRKIISKPLEKAKKQKSTGINQPPTITFAEEVRNSDITGEKVREVEVKNAILADFPFAHPNIKKAWSSLMVTDMEKEICAYYQRQKGELISELGDLTSRVSFSCEIIEARWISISAHFINDDFKLVKRLIGFKKVEFETLDSCEVHVIKSCISEWKLEDKIFSINTMFVHELLKEMFHTNLFMDAKDMVFLCLREEVAGIKYFLENNCSLEKDKIIKFFRYVLDNEINMKKFNAIAVDMGLPPIDEDWLKRQPMNWCRKTQLWKTYCSVAKLFKDALMYKAVIALTEMGEVLLSEVDPQHICWQMLEKVVGHFDALNNIMGTLSNFKYPTSNLCFPSITKLLAESYLRIFDLYYGVPDILCVSCVLDPRYKIKFLEYYFKKYRCGDGADKMFQTRELFETLFVAHAREGTNGGSSSPTGTADTQEEDSRGSEEDSGESKEDSGGSEEDSGESEEDLIEGFSQYIKNLKTIDRRSEMNQYLIEDTVDIGDAHFDVLGWWKENSLRYPVLSRMARTLLAVPACVYSVEENLALDLSVLEGVDPELVEAAICTKDWILTNA